MSSRKSSASKSWDTTLALKKELTKYLLELYLTPPENREAFTALHERVAELQAQLEEKYEIDNIYVPDPRY
jgi:hypothetical protein